MKFELFRKEKKTFDIISKIIIFFLILIIIISLYKKIIKKDDVIEFFGYSIAIVVSGSMEPEIKKGEFILIKKLSYYNINDIITYKENSNVFITHRIINKTNTSFITKGDNNKLADEEITKFQVIGKVIFHSKIIGIFIIYMLKPIYIFIVIALMYITKNNKKEEFL